MRETPVGMKCPACARMPLHARALGKPRHYALAAAAGLTAAAGIGILATLANLGLFGILLPVIAGIVVGRAVAWGAHGNRHGGFMGLAAAVAALGLVLGGLIAGSSLAGVAGPAQLLGLGLAALAAAFAAGS
jgi:hypothetical protein